MYIIQEQLAGRNIEIVITAAFCILFSEATLTPISMDKWAEEGMYTLYILAYIRPDFCFFLALLPFRF